MLKFVFLLIMTIHAGQPDARSYLLGKPPTMQSCLNQAIELSAKYPKIHFTCLPQKKGVAL